MGKIKRTKLELLSERLEKQLMMLRRSNVKSTYPHQAGRRKLRGNGSRDKIACR